MPQHKAPYRSYTPSNYSSTSSYYPGVNPYGTSVSDAASPTELIPYSPPSETVIEASAAPAAKSGGLSLPNLNEIKGFIDRMGGIDGIMATVGKVQKVMQGVQQFAPMAKLLMGSLLPGAKGKGVTTAQPDDDMIEYRPKKKRRRSSSGGSRKGSGTRKSGTKGKSKGRR